MVGLRNSSGRRNLPPEPEVVVVAPPPPEDGEGEEVVKVEVEVIDEDDLELFVVEEVCFVVVVPGTPKVVAVEVEVVIVDWIDSTSSEILIAISSSSSRIKFGV